MLNSHTGDTHSISEVGGREGRNEEILCWKKNRWGEEKGDNDLHHCVLRHVAKPQISIQCSMSTLLNETEE